METPAARNQWSTRGRNRGGRGAATSSARARSHLQGQARHAGRGGDPEELSALQRIAHKFCHGLSGSLRQESVRGVTTDPSVAPAETLAGDLEWLVVAVYEDQYPRQLDPNEAWRRMRERLEAVSVLSVLACTESYAWRRNVAFWRRFTQDEQDRYPTERGSRKVSVRRPQGDIVDASVPAPRDDMIMPRFLLDFSFAEISADVITLLRHVLLGSAKSMRLSFKHAMDDLATIPLRSPRAVSIPIALRFARCQLTGDTIIRKLIELVKAVNCARHQRQRQLGNATSKAFYYAIVELDLSNVRLSASDLEQLRLLQSTPQQDSFRLVLDNAIGVATEAILPFYSIVSTWFDSTASTEPDCELEPEALSFTPPNRTFGSNAMSLNSSALSCHHFESLFSAIGVPGSSITSRLSLRGAFQHCDPRVAWAWIAFGVLCGRRFCKLESLDLSRNILRREDAMMVRQITTATDEVSKLQLLYHLRSGTTAPIQAQLPKKNRRRRMSGKNQRENRDSESPLDAGLRLPWIRLPAGSRLTLSVPDKTLNLMVTSNLTARVVETKSDSDVVVLVPGYGFLNTKLSTEMFAEHAPESTTLTQGLQALKLNSMVVPGDVDPPDTVFEVLFSSLSLPTLTELELNGNPLGEGALRAVLSACPTLTVLSLEDCELASIGGIVEAYSRGACRIQSLNVAENQVSDRDVVELCRLIVREHTPASHLRALNLHLNPITHRSLHALSVAMRENRNALVHLVVDKDHDRGAQFRPVFYPYRDQFVGVELLSDAHQRELQDAIARRLGTTALEPSILALIHAYAATAVHRRVRWL